MCALSLCMARTGQTHRSAPTGCKVRFRPETALTRLGLAELLLEEAEELSATNNVGARSPRPGVAGRGDPAPTGNQLRRQAVEHLDFAIAEFQEMRMQPALERALRHKGLLKA